ncbi:MAG: hypothetical protein ACFCUQ_01910 [Kiloniellales bacterium]
MPEAQPYLDSDRDSLHTLPLAMIPLATPGLVRARLVKNARLEGMVELFSGEQTGSGQVLPCDLVRVFHFDASNKQDLDVVERLAELPSYDVFSLRIELQRIGIPVDASRHLRLSDGKIRSLNGHMRTFTRPLVAALYGNDDALRDGFADIAGLLSATEAHHAPLSLKHLAQALGIEVRDIPQFVEDYRDTYLPLAYYQSCLDENVPIIKEFMASVAQIRNDPKLRTNFAFVKALNGVQSKLMSAVRDIETVFEVLKTRTSGLWSNLDGASYRKTKWLIQGYQADIGKSLCAISVKMAAWRRRFPGRDSGSLHRRADFIMSDIKHSIESIQGLSYSHL